MESRAGIVRIVHIFAAAYGDLHSMPQVSPADDPYEIRRLNAADSGGKERCLILCPAALLRTREVRTCWPVWGDICKAEDEGIV